MTRPDAIRAATQALKAIGKPGEMVDVDAVAVLALSVLGEAGEVHEVMVRHLHTAIADLKGITREPCPLAAALLAAPGITAEFAARRAAAAPVAAPPPTPPRRKPKPPTDPA